MNRKTDHGPRPVTKAELRALYQTNPLCDTDVTAAMVRHNVWFIIGSEVNA
jgi:hypothetical protein